MAVHSGRESPLLDAAGPTAGGAWRTHAVLVCAKSGGPPESRSTWPGWPHGQLVAADGFKLRASERGLNRADLRFEEGGICIKTGGLDGGNVSSLLVSPLS